MSEDDIIIDQDLIDAYNAGYTLHRHEPELLNIILQSSDRKSEYIKALAKGKQSSELERVIQEQQLVKKRQKVKKPKR